MKYIFCLITLLMSATLVNGQTSKPITQISDLGDAIRFSHSDGTFTDVPNHSIGVVQTVYKSTSVLITIKSEGERDRILGLSTTTLLSPVFTTTQAILDTISAWTAPSAAVISPLPLMVDVIGIDSVRVLDSVRVWFNQTLDTSNQGILNSIFGILRDSLDKDVFINNDSLRVYFNQISDTTNQAILLDIHNLLVDSLDKDIYLLNDSLKVWFSQPLETKTDTANNAVLNAIHNLLADSLDKNLYILNDSIRVYFEQDTIDYEYKSYCYRSKLDSGVYSFNVVFNVLTPNTPSFINFTDIDSLNSLFEIDYRTGATFGTFPNIQQDFVPCERWDEIGVKTDTLKALSFTAIAKVRTNIDTLFNCKSLSFGHKSNASGTLVLTFENGETESFDVANDDLPNWVNGEFITQITYDATGAVGLIVNSLGCSQTSDNICAKVKPIFDCDTVTPITCNGWQSASGVWKTLSGCWNTGQ